jgi:hypothetical protein
MLSVWTAASEEWVIAESQVDARSVYCAFVGMDPHDQHPEEVDWGTHPEHWSRLPDDKPLTIRDEDEKPQRLTCGEWVAKMGRSYLGSANV